MGQGFIHIKGLHKSYQGPEQEIEVLRGLELEVQAGETVAVVGRSGVGKSTLLHIVGALDRPSRGSVQVDGQEIFSLPSGRLAAFRNRHVGFVFQFHHLLPEFSALENVMMPALIARWEPRRARQRAEELLGEVGLAERKGHRAGELSGGEQQRVALARALVMRPKLLLADEPTGNLDERTGGRVQEVLARLNEQYGLTTLVATHNVRLAAAMDRRVGLVKGLAKELE